VPINSAAVPSVNEVVIPQELITTTMLANAGWQEEEEDTAAFEEARRFNQDHDFDVKTWSDDEVELVADNLDKSMPPPSLAGVSGAPSSAATTSTLLNLRDTKRQGQRAPADVSATNTASGNAAPAKRKGFLW
jgi:hypothetical protein